MLDLDKIKIGTVLQYKDGKLEIFLEVTYVTYPIVNDHDIIARVIHTNDVSYINVPRNRWTIVHHNIMRLNNWHIIENYTGPRALYKNEDADMYDELAASLGCG